MSKMLENVVNFITSDRENWWVELSDGWLLSFIAYQPF